MLFSPLAILLIPAGYLFMWPLVDAWIEDGSPLLNGLTAIAVSMGTLMMFMMWLGFLPVQLISPWAFLIIIGTGLGLGYWLNPGWFSPKRWADYWLMVWKRYSQLSFEMILAWTVLGLCAVILIHSFYYPFIGDDTLARYALHGQRIYLNGRIPQSVFGYPPGAALTFVWTWFAANVQHEQLAKLFAVVSSVGTLGATYLLGRMWFGRKGGWLAAVLVVLPPAYVVNSTIAYVDIPTIFPTLLAVAFIWRWWEHNRLKDAAMAALLVGFALLIKQSALTFAASLAIVPIIYLIALRGRNWKSAVGAFALIVLIPALIAGPWYLRNVLLEQSVLPIAGYYHLAQRSAKPTFDKLLVPYVSRKEFGGTISEVLTAGWVLGVGLAIGEGIRLLRGKLADVPVNLIFATFAIPYWLAWWLYFSFDPRFLLLLLPFFALWISYAAVKIAERISLPVQVPAIVWQFCLVAVLGWFAFQATESRLGAVYYTLTDPFASQTARFSRAKDDTYLIIQYIRENIDPEESRLMLMDGRMLYYLPEYDAIVQYPHSMWQLEGYDYLVHSSGFVAIYEWWLETDYYRHAWSERYFDPVYEAGGVHVMRIKFASLEDRIRIANQYGEVPPEY